jgi:hypothetical protein
MKSRKSKKSLSGIQDFRLKLGSVEQFFTGLYNSLVNGLFPDIEPIVKLEQLPERIEFHENQSHTARASDDVDSYYRHAQASSILKKLELPLFEGVAQAACLEEWFNSERECKVINEALWEIHRNPLTHEHCALDDLVRAVAREVESLIGSEPPDLPEVSRLMKFGPGVTSSHSHGRTDIAHKLMDFSAYAGMDTDVSWLLANTMLGSSGVYGYFGSERSSKSTLAEVPVTYTQENKLAMVPKSVSRMRPVCTEPSLAVFVQQGYDGILRERLLGWGINLSDQSRNKDLAFKGSIPSDCPGRPCTIDLKSASDRISLGLVYRILPSLWFSTLLPLRSSRTDVWGESILLEKFSSMGNSLTFSLQTLIFAAVVRVILQRVGCEKLRWSVYGDDIIVPSTCYDDICRALELLGFEINTQKSFSEGNFRESCGGDYLLGVDVRPLYFKKPPSVVSDLYRMINSVQIFAEKAPIPGMAYAGLYRYLLRYVPDKFFIVGEPCVELDNWIWSPIDGLPAFYYRPVSKKSKVPKFLWYCRFLLVGGAEGTRIGTPSQRTVTIRGDVSTICRLRRPVRVGGRPDGCPDTLSFDPVLVRD